MNIYLYQGKRIKDFIWFSLLWNMNMNWNKIVSLEKFNFTVVGPRHKTTHSYEHSFLCRLCIDRVYVPCQCNHTHQIQVRCKQTHQIKELSQIFTCIFIHSKCSWDPCILLIFLGDVSSPILCFFVVFSPDHLLQRPHFINI